MALSLIRGLQKNYFKSKFSFKDFISRYGSSLCKKKNLESTCIKYMGLKKWKISMKSHGTFEFTKYVIYSIRETLTIEATIKI